MINQNEIEKEQESDIQKRLCQSQYPLGVILIEKDKQKEMLDKFKELIDEMQRINGHNSPLWKQLEKLKQRLEGLK